MHPRSQSRLEHYPCPRRPLRVRVPQAAAPLLSLGTCLFRTGPVSGATLSRSLPWPPSPRFLRLTLGNMYATVLCPCLSWSHIPLCGDKFGFINLLAHGQLGCLHFLAIINITAMNVCIKVFVGHRLSISLGLVARNGTGRWYGEFMFNFSRNYRSFLKWLHHFISHHENTSFSIYLNGLIFLKFFL